METVLSIKTKIAAEQLENEKKKVKKSDVEVARQQLAQANPRTKHKSVPEDTYTFAILDEGVIKEEPVDAIKEEPLEEQIVTEGGTSFVISEVEPPRKQIKISGYGTLAPAVKKVTKPGDITKWKIMQPTGVNSSQVTTIRKAPVKISSLANPLQQSRVIANSNGQIIISQHQLNLMQAGTETESIKCNYCPNFFVDETFVNEHIKQKVCKGDFFGLFIDL